MLCGEALENPVCTQQLDLLTGCQKVVFTVSNLQRGEGGFRQFIRTAKPGVRVKSLVAIAGGLDELQKWSPKKLAGADEGDGTELQDWFDRHITEIVTQLLEKLEELKATALAVVKERLDSAVQNLKPWARGAENKSWKASLAADCSWSDLLSAATTLLDPSLAEKSTKNLQTLTQDSAGIGSGSREGRVLIVGADERGSASSRQGVKEMRPIERTCTVLLLLRPLDPCKSQKPPIDSARKFRVPRDTSAHKGQTHTHTHTERFDIANTSVLL